MLNQPANAIQQKPAYRKSDVKQRLHEKGIFIVNESGKLVQEAVKNSRSKEIISQSAKSFTTTDNSMKIMSQNLNQMERYLNKLDNQTILMEQRLQNIGPVTKRITSLNSMFSVEEKVEQPK